MNPFTRVRSRSVAAWGERRLILALRDWLGPVSPPSPAGIGDDCALLPRRAARGLITVDPVLFGRHFDAATPPRWAGEKLVNRNVSDIAAMGGRPREGVVALALAPETDTAWLRAFYQGVAAAARRHGIVVVGGDVTQAPAGVFGAWFTLLGDAPPRPLTRLGARLGDLLYVTGTLGGSRLGNHLRFTPRLEEGRWLAGRREVRALTDVSDGLAKDLVSLVPARTRPSVLETSIPLSPAARRCARASGRPAWVHALGDGEDYELLFALSGRADSAAFEGEWRRRFPLRLTRLGRLVPATTPPATGEIRWEAHRGYEHLSP